MFKFIVPFIPLLGLAAAQDASCWGCQRGSECASYNGDLDYSSATYYLADRWLEEFGNSGDLEPEMARAVCDKDWCQILSNYGGGNRGYTYEQAQDAVNFVKSGEVDGCGNFRQQFIDTGNPDTSDYYLRFETISNFFACGAGMHMVDFYGGVDGRFEGPFCGSQA